jgi:hypothetical protein
MDYSLLFVVAYNPKYIELHPNLFEEGEKGEWKLKRPEIIEERVGEKKAAKNYKK